jgi:hypothetical protein
MVLGTLAAVAVAVALARGLGDRLERALGWLAGRRRPVVLVLALFTVVATALISALAFWHQNFTDDEYAYLFTAGLLRHGHLSVPMRVPNNAFRYQFLAHHGMRSFAIYGVVHAAILLPGLLIGLPHLGVHLAAGVVVVATAGIAQELFGDRQAVLAALVTATSPFLLATGATLHNAVTSTALLAVFLWLLIRFERRLQPADALVAGLALGLAIHVRTLDALAVATPPALVVLARLLALPERGRRLLGHALIVGAVVCSVGLYLLTNAELTGDWLQTPYDLFNRRWPGTSMFGFGKGPMKYFTNPPEVAFSKLVAQVARGSFWMFGWPLGILPVVAARGRRALLLSLVPLTVVAGYFFYYANSVSDTGPVYYLCALPTIAVLAVCGLDTLSARLSPAAPAAALGGLMVAGAAFFAPREFMAARQVARLVREPKRLVQRANLHRAIVMAQGMQPRGLARSWVFFPPIPGEPLDQEDVIWTFDVGTRAASLMAEFPTRRFYRLRWERNEPVLEPADREP